MSLYLALNIGSFIIPFIYSFERKMRFIQYYKAVFLSIFIVASFFIGWDIIFTKLGVWGFNSQYHLNYTLFGLPLEELLFFICIPYASIFTHYALNFFFNNLKLSQQTTKRIIYALLLITIVVFIIGFPKLYTSVNLGIFMLLLLYSKYRKTTILERFFITFLVILIPFFIVNGILTGSFIHNEVVWYNNNENLGIRLFTIPIEDIFYAFNLLYLNLILIEKFKIIFKKKQIQ